MLDALREVNHQRRFESIVTALYARWTELAPESAWASANEEENWHSQARRGVLITWLSRDLNAALEELLTTPHESDLAILTEFLKEHVQHSPHEAALFVDMVAEVWPQADDKLFPLVAQAWVILDPDSTGEWVASHPNVAKREKLLRTLAQQTARNRGLKGMELANLIETPDRRDAARLNTARWVGINFGSRLLQDRVHPDNDLRGGYPDDWSRQELRHYALGSMANFSEGYPLLVLNAQSEEQRQDIYYGAISGAAFSQPALVSGAVTALDSQLLDGDPKIQNNLQSFIKRWHEIDATAAEDWLNQQPADGKTAVMREAIPQS